MAGPPKICWRVLISHNAETLLHMRQHFALKRSGPNHEQIKHNGNDQWHRVNIRRNGADIEYVGFSDQMDQELERNTDSRKRYGH